MASTRLPASSGAPTTSATKQKSRESSFVINAHAPQDPSKLMVPDVEGSPVKFRRPAGEEAKDGCPPHGPSSPSTAVNDMDGEQRLSMPGVFGGANSLNTPLLPSSIYDVHSFNAKGGCGAAAEKQRRNSNCPTMKRKMAPGMGKVADVQSLRVENEDKPKALALDDGDGVVPSSLDAIFDDIQALLNEPGSLENGDALELSCEEILAFLDGLDSLGNGEALELGYEEVLAFLDELDSLENGDALELSCEEIMAFLDELDNLKNREVLELDCEETQTFLDELGSLENHEALDLSCEEILAFLDELDSLENGEGSWEPHPPHCSWSACREAGLTGPCQSRHRRPQRDGLHGASADAGGGTFK